MTGSSTSQLPVLVAGGGIGGLAAALALVRQGFQVKVLEQAPEIGEIGAGIQLGPNAFHAFDASARRPVAAPSTPTAW
jgi:3-hydroxybenzoate 6-monooxygenase